VAVLIPSIDLMGGKIVQLVQGKKKALEFDDFGEWISRFANYPLVQLIDLDAAIGSGNNRDLLRSFTERLPCQVGGGIRSIEDAEKVFAAGAKRVILGSVLVRENAVDTAVAKIFADKFGADRLTFAVDSKNGRVAIKGWRETTSLLPAEMMRMLEPYCAAFLYTHIDTEGLMRGFPVDVVRALRTATSRQLIVAGGISSHEEVDQIHALGADSVVGMAIYSGKMKLEGNPA
jgi:phosphoribosylformimino-5-aminoimidazole carboxamide ribotide isomerase